MPGYLKILFSIIFIYYLLSQPVIAGSSYPLSLIIEKGDGRKLISIPIEHGELFIIRYIHSVDISPVYEVFYADEKKGIIIKETYFKMFGAGMGHWPGRGRIVEKNGWIFIKDMNIVLGEFYLRIGAASVDHTIVLRGAEIHLSRMIPGMRVRLYVSQGGK